jgi:hypothetical protein
MLLPIFILLWFSLPGSKEETYQLTIIPGTWTIANATTCFSNLYINTTFFKIIESNNVTKEATLNYFLPNGTEISGKCIAQVSNISSGLITTVFSCNTIDPLFQYVENNVVAQWDAYNELALTLNMTQTMTVGNITNTTYCSISGNNISIYYEENTWNITSCSCFACCYNLYTPFTIKRWLDMTNFPGVNISGAVSGPYCNGTMLTVDQCALNSTTVDTDYDPVQTITNMMCNYLGNRETTQLTFSNGSVFLNWGNTCTMEADPYVSSSDWGDKVKVIFMMVWIFLIFLTIE